MPLSSSHGRILGPCTDYAPVLGGVNSGYLGPPAKSVCQRPDTLGLQTGRSPRTVNAFIVPASSRTQGLGKRLYNNRVAKAAKSSGVTAGVTRTDAHFFCGWSCLEALWRSLVALQPWCHVASWKTRTGWGMGKGALTGPSCRA